jgi:hypothetical protein
MNINGIEFPIKDKNGPELQVKEASIKLALGNKTIKQSEALFTHAERELEDAAGHWRMSFECEEKANRLQIEYSDGEDVENSLMLAQKERDLVVELRTKGSALYTGALKLKQEATELNQKGWLIKQAGAKLWAECNKVNK